ncbi:antirestriction protein ArdA [Undibacterium oligocarboniphilum]|uniref:Antirestriction protein ArdA n=1 Tax=Undibacterium oligocarboniphilum TaxID=666702 RepID=A0A850Q7M8_9BURK|nr:antirestriction protein ArdA [Undibacterium oligocarboniphilum]MBC3871145.1 antirestriction protein ArdA [Undibacterium oligocarboniphilum]NVO76232.1 antirestriction protein ArdA [Undibacterium oligocarboniphilum]
MPFVAQAKRLKNDADKRVVKSAKTEQVKINFRLNQPKNDTKAENIMNTLFAQPFNRDANGFYFYSLESYTEKAENLLDRFGNPVEEFEIQFIDGDDCELFTACGVDQGNLHTWFESVLDLSDYEKTALFYLCSILGYSLVDSLEKIDDVNLSEGSLKDVAVNLFDECYLNDVPESVRAYIDYEKFARDCELGGDLCEFDFNGKTRTCTNASRV